MATLQADDGTRLTLRKLVALSSYNKHVHFDDILTLGVKILIRSGGRYCSYNNKYGHNLDPTYLKGIKMQSPFCILTSYHGKFRNLGNLYISTFSTSTWLYCPFRIHPVSSTSALSFFRKKIKSFN